MDHLPVVTPPDAFQKFEQEGLTIYTGLSPRTFALSSLMYLLRRCNDLEQRLAVLERKP